MIKFNIILPFAPRSSKSALSFRLPYQIPAHISILSQCLVRLFLLNVIILMTSTKCEFTTAMLCTNSQYLFWRSRPRFSLLTKVVHSSPYFQAEKCSYGSRPNLPEGRGASFLVVITQSHFITAPLSTYVPQSLYGYLVENKYNVRLLDILRLSASSSRSSLRLN